jgi:hypothetical protein
MAAATDEGPQGRVDLARRNREILYELGHSLREIHGALHVRLPILLYERTVGVRPSARPSLPINTALSYHYPALSCHSNFEITIR